MQFARLVSDVIRGERYLTKEEVGSDGGSRSLEGQVRCQSDSLVRKVPWSLSCVCLVVVSRVSPGQRVVTQRRRWSALNGALKIHVGRPRLKQFQPSAECGCNEEVR